MESKSMREVPKCIQGGRNQQRRRMRDDWSSPAKAHCSTAPVRVTVRLRHDKEHFAALLDTGASKRIVNKSFVLASAKHGYNVVPQVTTVFETMSQDVTSSGTIVARFLF